MIKYCSLEVVPEIFCLIMLSNQKNNQIKLTEHGLFKPSNLVPCLIFIAWFYRHWSVLLDHMTLTLDREGIKGKYLMSTCILFLLPFSTAFSKVWILLLKKPNSHWSRVNAWVNFWQLNNNFLCKSELYWSPNWIDQATPVGNNTENTITMNFRTQIDLQFC